MKHAIINKEGIVVNIVISPEGNFKCPEGYQKIEVDIVRMGDRYTEGKFIAPDGTER